MAEFMEDQHLTDFGQSKLWTDAKVEVVIEIDLHTPGSRGPTPPQQPNRKSPTLDQSTHVPNGSPEKQSPPQPRPDLRGSTLPQEPYRKSPTLDQSTHGPRGSPEKQSPPQPRPDLRGSTLPQEPNRKSPTLDQSTHVPSGSPEKRSLSQPRPEIRPPQRSKSTSFDSRGNSFGRSGFYIGGFGNFNWILGPLLLYYSFATSTSQPIGIKVDLQSDLVVFGKTLYLKCSINDSIANKTYIWSRRSGQSTDAINFNSISTTNAAKFKIIDGGLTLGIKNLNEKDITECCYYCRSKSHTTYSKCTYILDHNNTVVLPSKTAVTFPMNKTIWLQSECYPNLTFFMIIQNRVVANQTATKKDNNRLYEIDMTFNGTLKGGEQFLVVARHGNKNITVYNSTDLQIIKPDQKGDNDKTGLVIGLVVAGCVVLVAIIALYLYWRRNGGYCAASTKEGIL